MRCILTKLHAPLGYQELVWQSQNKDELGWDKPSLYPDRSNWVNLPHTCSGFASNYYGGTFMNRTEIRRHDDDNIKVIFRNSWLLLTAFTVYVLKC